MERAVLAELLAARAARRPAVLATELATGRQELLYPGEERPAGVAPALWEAAAGALAQDKSDTVIAGSGPAGAGDVFLHAFAPPLRLILIGAVHIAQALAPMAALCGWAVVIVDPRRAFATAERFPAVELVTTWPDAALAALAPDRRTAVVTLTHDPKLDDPALAAALPSPAFFIGALGSRKTHGDRLRRLGELGFGEAELARIHGPVGLAVGGRTTAEIAVSILAQAIAVLRGQAP